MYFNFTVPKVQPTKNNNAVVNYELNNNLYNNSLSSVIFNNNNAVVNYELNNNLYNTSLSSTIKYNYNYNALTNRITSLNNLLTADFNLVEATAFSSVAANFANIIGTLVEAYMILDLRTRVSSLELIQII